MISKNRVSTRLWRGRKIVLLCCVVERFVAVICVSVFPIMLRSSNQRRWSDWVLDNDSCTFLSFEDLQIIGLYTYRPLYRYTIRSMWSILNCNNLLMHNTNLFLCDQHSKPIRIHFKNEIRAQTPLVWPLLYRCITAVVDHYWVEPKLNLFSKS